MKTPNPENSKKKSNPDFESDETKKKIADKYIELLNRVMKEGADEGKKIVKPTSDRAGLSPTPNAPVPSFSELIKEGEKLLAEDKKESPKKSSKKETLPPTSTNPYLQARHNVLAKYPQWRREEVARLEKEGDINNRHYDDFIRDVAAEGDRLTNS